MICDRVIDRMVILRRVRAILKSNHEQLATSQCNETYAFITYIRDVQEYRISILLRGYVSYMLDIVVECGVTNPGPACCMSKYKCK